MYNLELLVFGCLLPTVSVTFQELWLSRTLSLVLQALQVIDFLWDFQPLLSHGLWLSLIKALKTGNTPFVTLFLHVSVCFQYLLAFVALHAFRSFFIFVPVYSYLHDDGSNGCYSSAIRLDIGISRSSICILLQALFFFNFLLFCDVYFYLQEVPGHPDYQSCIAVLTSAKVKVTKESQGAELVKSVEILSW